jgi:hypothetical protein
MMNQSEYEPHPYGADPDPIAQWPDNHPRAGGEGQRQERRDRRERIAPRFRSPPAKPS